MNNKNTLINEICELHNTVDSLLAQTNEKMTNLIQQLNAKHKTNIVNLRKLQNFKSNLVDFSVYFLHLWCDIRFLPNQRQLQEILRYLLHLTWQHTNQQSL